MCEKNAYLLLWLEGPLQAWGHDSKFGVRNTLNFPTRSGILGLLCCARGAGGEQREWLEKMSPMAMEVLAFDRSDAEGEPIMREATLRDFHMVGSGYDDADPWQNLLIPKTAQGKKPNGAGTKMTYRYYLQDALFAVILEIPADEKEALEDALQNPRWDLYLGRKNCVPTELIYQGIYHSTDTARQRAQELAENKCRQLSYIIVEGEKEGGEVFTLNDVPVQFGVSKRYRDRRVTLLEQ